MTFGTMGSFAMMAFQGNHGAGAELGNTRSAELSITYSDTGPIPQYGKFEARIRTDSQFTNPFDPAEANVQVHFLTPAGETHILPTFYDEEDGKAVWKVRYAPLSVGDYSYYAMFGDQHTGEHKFKCVPSDRDGFVRLSPHDYRYFQFDSGKPYFAVGHNVCWTDDYEHYFKRMAEHGENFTRIWMIHWNIALEWSGGDYPGLGRYHLGKANWIDRILDLAEQHGIYIMLCLDSFNTLRIRQPYPAYEGNPYSKENGGMLEKPEQFFTNPEARRLFKQRLRYLVARYTYSPNILCWEFWNEVDIVERYISEEAVPWHQEMARYLRQIDPMKHLISTSFANTKGDDAMWQLPEMEITQNHQYGSRDIAESVRQWTQRNIREFHKPHIFGEFGADSSGPRREKDPDGISLHNGIWAAILSGSAGTAMLWWWDNYIRPNDLYYHFKPLSLFVEDVGWTHANFRDAEIGTIDYINPPDIGTKDLELPCTVGWGHHPVRQYCILSDGTIENDEQITQFIYPPGNELRQEQTFIVEYPVDGEFEIHVNKVSNHGRLQIRLDGELALDQDLPTGAGDGPWKESDFVERWGIYQNTYDRRFGIPVPAGKHTIAVDNQGKDWISLKSYKLTNYQTNEKPELRVFGLQNDTTAILWLQNTGHTWYRVFEKMPLEPVLPTYIEVNGLRDGSYEIEWWDTYQADRVKRADAVCTDGILRLDAPKIEYDIACKIRFNSEIGR
ncbi:DUF5060 domain-containing protein [Candidatus Poribacteria bacterium]